MAYINSTEAYGRSYPEAYIRVISCEFTKQLTTIKTEGWESQALREENLPALAGIGQEIVLATDMELTADNPIAYAYKLLEASGRFPDATWNVVANVIKPADPEVVT